MHPLFTFKIITKELLFNRVISQLRDSCKHENALKSMGN